MRLRFIEGYDTRRIVEWRNTNAEYFPSQEPWTEESHLHWYAQYLADATDFMYMVGLDDGTPVGTIGITSHGEGNYEIGRVMLGERELSPPGIMSQALQEVIKRHEGGHYWLKVIKGNSRAVRFYEKNGFKHVTDDSMYLFMWRTGPDDPAVQAQLH